MPPSLQNEVSQFRELARHFFSRFFDNDLISADGDMRSTVVNILAILAAPGMLLPFLFLSKYTQAAGRCPCTCATWPLSAKRNSSFAFP